MTQPPAPAAPETAAVEHHAPEEEWQRLDPRMLLVHPVREVIRFLPALVAVFVAGSRSSGPPWELLGVAVPVLLGLLRYLTTRFRIAAGRVELRRGLLNRHVLSARLDRVRTVDLSASPIQRVLGLTRVRVGTGTASTDEDERLDLDGLPRARAQRLRDELLRAGAAGRAGGAGTAEGPPGAAEAAAVAEPTLRLDPRWVRYAPLTSTGLVATAAVVGAASQLLDNVDAFDRVDPSSWSVSVPLALVVPAAVVVLLLVMGLLAMAGYVLTNWSFRLWHAAGAWHATRGLLTTRETSLDDERIAGLSLAEPPGLRLAGAGRLTAIVTGLGRTQQGSAVLVPPAPRRVVDEVAAEVLGTPTPVRAELRRHGVIATRRRWTRALLPPALVTVLTVVAVVAGASAAWLVVPAVVVGLGALLAVDRAAGLGHALVGGHLVARSGSLLRRRDMLATEHVIGWTWRATYFQRRAGLTTLLATTAGGRQSVLVLDVPETESVALAGRAVPGLVDQFLAHR